MGVAENQDRCWDGARRDLRQRRCLQVADILAPDTIVLES